MSPAEHDTEQARAFVDALRGWLGLAPLYRQEEPQPLGEQVYLEYAAFRCKTSKRKAEH